MMLGAAVYGASGYAGGELIRLLDGHPDFEVAVMSAHRNAGEHLGTVHPQLGGGERPLLSAADAETRSVDVAFLALPHGASAGVAHRLASAGTRVVDLGADHRFADAGAYTAAYGTDHPHPDELGSWVYGLPELNPDVAGATRVAVPGCYPTATLLAVTPLVRAGVVAPERIVVDAVSGVTGAGRSLRDDLLFGAVAEGVRAYGVAGHRHRPEMEAALAAFTGAAPRVVFTPHLVPMQRGLLATCYATAAPGVGAADVATALESAYEKASFVTVLDHPPQTRWVVGTNRALVAAMVDEHAGTVIAMGAIDNLVKGAAGQAVQCANLMFGLQPVAGLEAAGWLP